MLPWSRLRRDLGNALGDLPPFGAASTLGIFRFAFERLRNHRIDLFDVEGPLRMIDQRLREGEYDRFVLLDKCQSLLIRPSGSHRCDR
jgi:hypothetical protein